MRIIISHSILVDTKLWDLRNSLLLSKRHSISSSVQTVPECRGALEALRISTESRRLRRRLINSDTKTVSTGPDGTSILQPDLRLNTHTHTRLIIVAHLPKQTEKKLRCCFNWCPSKRFIPSDVWVHMKVCFLVQRSIHSSPDSFFSPKEKQKQHQYKIYVFNISAGLSCLLSPDMCCIF